METRFGFPIKRSEVDHFSWACGAGASWVRIHWVGRQCYDGELMTLSLRKRASCCVICMVLVYASGSLIAQEKSGIIYSQRAERDDMFFSKVFYPRNGRIYLTNDSIVFKAKDVYGDVFNFPIANLRYKLYPKPLRIYSPEPHPYHDEANRLG
jgi:hypothetical protein